MYVYVYVCMCVCACVYMSMCAQSVRGLCAVCARSVRGLCAVCAQSVRGLCVISAWCAHKWAICVCMYVVLGDGGCDSVRRFALAADELVKKNR